MFLQCRCFTVQQGRETASVTLLVFSNLSFPYSGFRVSRLCFLIQQLIQDCLVFVHYCVSRQQILHRLSSLCTYYLNLFLALTELNLPSPAVTSLICISTRLLTLADDSDFTHERTKLLTETQKKVKTSNRFEPFQVQIVYSSLESQYTGWLKLSVDIGLSQILAYKLSDIHMR